MKNFQSTFKLYAYKNKDKCDLSIKVTDDLVFTFKLTHKELEKIFNNPAEFNSASGQYWFVFNKTKLECMRITVSSHGMDYNFRASYHDWELLKRSYEQQMSTPQPWDDK